MHGAAIMGKHIKTLLTLLVSETVDQFNDVVWHREGSYLCTGNQFIGGQVINLMACRRWARIEGIDGALFLRVKRLWFIMGLYILTQVVFTVLLEVQSFFEKDLIC